MKHRHLLLASAIAAATLALAACKKEAAPGTDTASSSAPAGETADQFVARINAEFKAAYPEMTSAQWLSSTYINSDSERIAAKANERSLTQLNSWIEQAAKFDGKPMSEDSKRAIHLLKLMSSMPAPRDPAKLAELTQIATRMEGSYGAGKYCTDANDPNSCRQLGELEQVLARSRDYDKQLDARQGWHSTTKNMRGDYQKFVGLVNEGAKGMGFTDAGQMWRSGYDMPPEQIGPETDRLWEQVKPMYEQLHCYARAKLDKTYGKDKAEVGNGLIAAHLLGNMWQQDWSNLWDQLEPYRVPAAGHHRCTGKAVPDQPERGAGQGRQGRQCGGPVQGAARSRTAHRQADDRARAGLLRVAGHAVTAAVVLGKTQFIKPDDRDVVCHASAWDMNMEGDVRTKMCIKPNEENFTTIYHELGHIYYDLAYNPLPPLFRAVPTTASMKRSATPSCWR